MQEGEKGSDRSNLEDLKEAARGVAVECVIRPPHLGGWVQVGWEGKMKMEVVRYAERGGKDGDIVGMKMGNGTDGKGHEIGGTGVRI